MSTSAKTIANNNKKSTSVLNLLSPLRKPVGLFMCGGNLVYMIVQSIAVTATEKFLSPEHAADADYFFVPSGIPLLREIIAAVQFALRSAFVLSIVTWCSGVVLISCCLILLVGFGYFAFASGDHANLLSRHRYDITLPFAIGTACGWALHYNWRFVPLLGDSWINAMDKPHYIVTSLALCSGFWALVAGMIASNGQNKLAQEGSRKSLSAEERVAAALTRAMNGEDDENEETIRKRKENAGDDRKGEKSVQELEKELEAARTLEEVKVENFISGKGWTSNFAMFIFRFMCGVTFGFLCGAGCHVADAMLGPLMSEFTAEDSSLYSYWQNGLRVNQRKIAQVSQEEVVQS